MKIVCISDTHSRHWDVKVPKADILVFAGDIGLEGSNDPKPLENFNYWLGTLECVEKIVIAGNHDFFCEKHSNDAKSILTNCHYLNHESIIIGEIKIFGSPISAWFYDWAFNVHRGPKMAAKWAQIPNDTNILITHGPPYNILDLTPRMQNVGDEDLAKRITQLPKLKAHIFGHTHQSYGTLDFGGVKFINSSICTENYEPLNKPVIIDI